jgi:hypothetical protein
MSLGTSGVVPGEIKKKYEKSTELHISRPSVIR